MCPTVNETTVGERRAKVAERLAYLTDQPVTLVDVTPFLSPEQATEELTHACHILERALMSDLRFKGVTARETRYYIEQVWRKLHTPLVGRGIAGV